MTREVSDDELRLAKSLGFAAVRAGGDFLCARLLGDGRAVYLMQWSYGGVTVAIGTAGDQVFDDQWNYQFEQASAGWRAALGWDGEGEPEGWYRHPHSGRRRPDGDPAKEFVRL